MAEDRLPAEGLPAEGLPADGLPADGLPADGPAGGRAGAGGTSSAAISGARDTSLARIAALTVIFDPVITLARRPARPAHAGQLARSAPGRFS